jgi:predicted permease
MERTHGPRLELMRHFLATMFDSEMFSVRHQWATVAVSAFALTIPAGLILLEAPSGRKLAISAASAQAMAWTDRLSSVTLLMSITAILALLAWQSLLPSRRDYLALAGLPVRSRQIFAARFACVLLLGAAITLVLMMPPTGAAPHAIKLATGGMWLPVSSAAARAAATAFGCIFAFFALVGLQGLMINVLPAKWVGRWSGYAQGALLAAAVLTALYSWFIPEWRSPEVAGLLRRLAWAPPVWFLGLHEKMGGARDPFVLAMAARAVRAAAGSVGFAMLMYATASARYRRLLLESGEGLAPRRMAERRFPRWLARNPRQEAILQFVAAVLSRSRVHRLVLMGYAGAGLAIMVNAVLLAKLEKPLDFMVLYWPMGLSFVALAGVRHAFAMPAEWKANWLFRLTESQGRRDWMSAVERFVVCCVIGPIHAVSLMVSMASLGPAVALRMTVLQILVALIVFEFLFYSWQQLPFACSYAPGKTSLIAQLGAWLVIMHMIVPLIARIVASLAQMGWVFAAYSPVFVAVLVWARWRRRDGWGEAPLLYEDTVDAVADLGIREMGFGGTLSAAAPAERQTSAPALPSAYYSVAKAFPEEFREACGADMEQATADAWGSVGRTRLMGDLLLRLFVEHASQLWRDIRYGLRCLASSPGFTAVAVISLSLGICIATCAFSELNGMVFRELPGVARPAELVAMERPVSYPAFRRYHARDDLFRDSAAYVAAVPFGVSRNGHTERVWGHLITDSYFATFGVRPALGTTVCVSHCAVISFRFWQERLGGDPRVVGQTLRVNGQSVTIAGVTEEGFAGAAPSTASDLWLPLPPDAGIAPSLTGIALERADLDVLTVVARLGAGVTLESAESALDTIARQFEQDSGDSNRNRRGRRVTLVEGGKCLPLGKQDKPYFTTFFTVMAGLILIIACANAANMMLARATGRRREVAVRLALGASRGRIVRQLVTESLLVAGGAGILGAFASLALMRSLGGLRMPLPIPVQYDFLAPDGRVLLMTIGISLVTGVLFGLAPALQVTRAALTPALKEGGHMQVRRFRRLSLRNVLMVAQVAGSVTLLVILGYLSVGIQSKLGVQVGFNPANLHLISLDPTRDGYSPERSADFLAKLLERVQGTPSVTSASLSVTVPVAMGIDQVSYTAPGAAGGAREARRAMRHIVGKDYFAVTGIGILAGRGFLRTDEAEDATAIVVSEALVDELWKGQDALGRTLEIANADTPPAKILPSAFDYRPRMHSKERRVYQVVGVARDVAEGLVTSKRRAAIYFPMRPSDRGQPSQQGVTLMVRAAPGVDAISLVLRELAAMDPNVAPFYTGTMAQHIEEFMSPLRVASWTYGSIGFFGLVLAAVGLAGMTAYSVASRHHEIGIRIALGAAKRDVLGLVLREGAALIAIGGAIGMAGAWVGSRGLAAMSTSVGQVATTSANDPLVLVGAPVLLAALALAACYVPARRSLLVDPAVTLRGE